RTKFSARKEFVELRARKAAHHRSFGNAIGKALEMAGIVGAISNTVHFLGNVLGGGIRRAGQKVRPRRLQNETPF
ncbi:MAG: hypothetical protein JWQ49_1891, partial [Edaphobacter sp.]|nr:hypothetical protein [Edaphobacter sp.]